MLNGKGKHGAKVRPPSGKTADEWPLLPDTSDEEDAELQEIKGNSLQHHQQTTKSSLDLKLGRSRPLETFTASHEEDDVVASGPFYQDQDQDQVKPFMTFSITGKWRAMSMSRIFDRWGPPEGHPLSIGKKRRKQRLSEFREARKIYFSLFQTLLHNVGCDTHIPCVWQLLLNNHYTSALSLGSVTI